MQWKIGLQTIAPLNNEKFEYGLFANDGPPNFRPYGPAIETFRSFDVEAKIREVAGIPAEPEDITEED